ncbi:MAG: hypothetical protein SFY80_02125 [Verrucomicrobiota bacterium]|nr:hypothetical protein [Verrucomicrobiota bacterium]
MNQLSRIITALVSLTCFSSLAQTVQAADLSWLYVGYSPYAWSPVTTNWSYLFSANGAAVYSYDLATGETVVLVPASGNAPETLAGKTFTVEAYNFTMIFKGDGTFDETGTGDEGPYSQSGSYEYFKTGGNQSALLIMYDSASDGIVAIKLEHSTSTSGTLKGKLLDAENGSYEAVESAFTLSQ